MSIFKAVMAGPTLLLFVVVLLVVAPAASAAEPNAFGFAKVTMQTLEKQRVGESPITSESRGEFRLEDVPSTFTQAGGHPWALATTIEFTNEEIEGPPNGTIPRLFFVDVGGGPKDIVVDLPPGLLGDPQAVPRCPLAVAVASKEGQRCPLDTEIGDFRLRWFDGKNESLAPIVNLVPEKGQSAEFGLEVDGGAGVVLTAHVVHAADGVSGCTLVGGCYGLTVVSNEIPNLNIVEVETTFWGVPADPSHDPMRGLVCNGNEGALNSCGRVGAGDVVGAFLQPGEILSGPGVGSGVPLAPFVTLPVDCAAGPEVTRVSSDSWTDPGRYVEGQALMPGSTGCGVLRFDPGVEAQPDTLLADTPVGLGVNLKVPQVLKPEAPETPQLRDLSVTLPAGLSISPGIVDGIQACNESGPEGINFEGPESEETGLNGEPQLAAGHCPDASIVGTAEAETPLLGEPVKGHVYLARPGCGDAALGQAACTEQDALDGNLYQLYLELGGTGGLADAGVNLKVRLKTEADPATGQLTTVTVDNPQLPFSELRVRLNGGPRSPLDNPEVCGPC